MAAGFTRLALARKAKLSDTTIKFVEAAKHSVSRTTLLRLIGVAELGLTWSDVASLDPAARAPMNRVPDGDRPRIAAESSMNCYLSPTYDPIAMLAELGRFLRGAGGYVEQTAAYLDVQSAADYLTLCQQCPVVAALRATLPLGEIMDHIAERTSADGLDVVALGVGDGQLEVRLVQALRAALSRPVLELCMVDVSQPLLARALQHASQVFEGQSELRVWGLQANFHHLPLHTDLYAPPDQRRRRLFVMLGNTLDSLESELRFFRHSLLGAEPEDLLLLDFQCVAAPADQPEEIKRCDPSWHDGLSVAHQTWLAGPLWRYVREVSAVRFEWALETMNAVPGSYALSAIATVQAYGCPDRRFSMFRFRRYEADGLKRCLAECGWECIAQVDYGPSGHRVGLILCHRLPDG